MALLSTTMADGIHKNGLYRYARYVEQQAQARALQHGETWPGSTAETEFFLGAMAIFMFMEQPGMVPDHWVSFLDPYKKLGSVVSPSRSKRGV